MKTSIIAVVLVFGVSLSTPALAKDTPGIAAAETASLRNTVTVGVVRKVKDAVVDMLRERNGRRPDVNPTNPDVAIVLHLRGQEARLFLDLAGEPLHRRGYRVAMVEAPLKETLAAAVETFKQVIVKVGTVQ